MTADLETISIFRLVFACLVLLAMLAGFAWIMRLMAARGWLIGAPSTSRRRLQLIEAINLDTRHRLAIVKYDNSEHLIVLSPDHATLLNSQVARTARIEPEDAALQQTNAT